MAPEHESSNGQMFSDEENSGNLINKSEEDTDEKGSTNTISSETEANEAEFERRNLFANNLGHVKRDDLDKPDSLSIQIDEEVDGAVDPVVPQKQVNSYAAKKTVAQGMMDIALITANANQLRYIIEFSRNSSTYYLNLFLIVISLLLQVGVGVSLIFKGRMDLRGESKHRNAKIINNYVVVGIFLVTIINVFIASFTITGTAKE